MLKFALVSFAIKARPQLGFACTLRIQRLPTQEFRLHFMHRSLCLFSSWAAHMQLHDRIMYARRSERAAHIMWLVGRQSNALQHTRRAGISRCAQVNKCLITTRLWRVVTRALTIRASGKL
jgi:hypothetical protein